MNIETQIIDTYHNLLPELITTENVDSYLEQLSNFAVMKRDKSWNLIWWNEYYIPLFNDFCILPPLISYNIFSASVKGDKRSGKNFRNIKEFDLLGSFFTKISKSISEQAILDKDSTDKYRMEIAERFARFISYRLMDIIESDIKKISKKNILSIFQLQWAVFKESLNNPDSILPEMEYIAIKNRNGFLIDPFFMKYESDLFEINKSNKKLYGQDLSADSQKVFFSSVGEYAKTDMGQIPELLNRLLPTELLLLYKGFYGKSRGRAGALRKQTKAMFLYKAVNNELWQRYSKRLINSRTRPELILQIDFKDDIENHRLLFPPQAPIVSFYRAMILEFIIKMMHLTKKNNWALDIYINHFLLGKTNSYFLERKCFPVSYMDKKSLFLSLVKKIPNLFTFNVDYNANNQILELPQNDYTFWIKLFIGSKEKTNDLIHKQSFNSMNELGIRVDCLEDYSLGIEFSNIASEANEIDIENYEYCDNPSTAANQIISVLSEQKIEGLF